MTILRKYGAALITGVLALVAALVGIGALTVWRPADQIVASGSTGQPYIMSRAGVLGLYADEVTITATAPRQGAQVALALGSAGDVQGWLKTSPYTEITGLADIRARALKIVTHGVLPSEDSQQSGDSASPSASASASASASGTQSGDADMGPLTSDMWVREVAGTGTVSMTVQGAQTDDVLIAATDGRAAAPTITLSWPESRPNLVAWGALALAALLAIGAGVFVLFERRQAARAAERGPATRHMRARADATPTQMLRLPSAHPAQHPAAPAPAQTPTDQAKRARPERARGAAFAPVRGSARAGGTGGSAAPTRKPEERTPSTPERSAQARPAQAESAPRRGSHAGPASQEPEARPARPPRVIDVSGVSPGVVFPSRRALREARERGQDKIVLDGHEFNTGLIPIVGEQQPRRRRRRDEEERRGDDA